MAFGVFESLAQAEQKGGKNAQNKAGDISPQQMEPQNTGIAVKQDEDVYKRQALYHAGKEKRHLWRIQ